MRNSRGPRTEPFGTPEITCHVVDLLPQQLLVVYGWRGSPGSSSESYDVCCSSRVSGEYGVVGVFCHRPWENLIKLCLFGLSCQSLLPVVVYCEDESALAGTTLLESTLGIRDDVVLIKVMSNRRSHDVLLHFVSDGGQGYAHTDTPSFLRPSDWNRLDPQQAFSAEPLTAFKAAVEGWV